MEKSVTISEISKKDITPKVSDETAKKLMPKNPMKLERMEFLIKGVNSSIPSALRRVILTGLTVKALNFDMKAGNYETSDKFNAFPYVNHRIRMIPVNQNIPLDAKFSLNIANDTSKLMFVKTSHLKSDIKSNYKLFDETITICTLQPGKYIRIKNIFVEEDTGKTDGGFCVACNAVSLAQDVVPLNMYTGEGVSSSVASPREFKIAFNTCGTMTPEKIVKAACEEIVRRLRNVEKKIFQKSSVDNVSILKLDDEDATIGEILQRQICEIYPDIEFCSYHSDDIGKFVKLKLVSSEPELVIKTAIKETISILNKVGSKF